MIRRPYIRKVEGRLERLEDDIDHYLKLMAIPVSDFRDRIDEEIRDPFHCLGFIASRPTR